MKGPTKDRLNDCGAGLVETGLATRKEAEQAQRRVVQETV